jgi:hypothetical protein
MPGRDRPPPDRPWDCIGDTEVIDLIVDDLIQWFVCQRFLGVTHDETLLWPGLCLTGGGDEGTS